MLKFISFLLLFIYLLQSCGTPSSANTEESNLNDTLSDEKKDTVVIVIKKDTVPPDSAFKRKQLKNTNPQIAYSEKEAVVRKLIEENNIEYASVEVFFRIIKLEQILEVWAKDRTKTDKYKLIKIYNLCVTKNRDTLRGIDLLVPESFYYVKYFHPANPYFLRMEVNFPNASDKRRGRSGGDIAIHGGCFSTYCTPFTDEDIKEIYIFAVEAKSKGQVEVPVHNFPFRMTDENMEKYKKDPRYINKPKRTVNWDNMKYGFEYFEKNKTLFSFDVDEKGKYLYKD